VALTLENGKKEIKKEAKESIERHTRFEAFAQVKQYSISGTVNRFLAPVVVNQRSTQGLL
jgi:hypothetical protein